MIDRPSRSLHVRYDDRVAEYTFEMLDQLELAYAVTVHKSQGSEFDAVVMPVSGSRSKLFYRNLLYTAVTRAKKLLVLVGQASAVAVMVPTTAKPCATPIWQVPAGGCAVMLRDLTGWLLDLIYPPVCVLCGDTRRENSSCPACRDNLEESARDGSQDREIRRLQSPSWNCW